jgi:acyl carrier protein
VSALSGSRLEQAVVEIIASFGHDPAQLTRDADLGDLDLDSLDMIELAQVLEEDHGVVVNLDAVRAAEPKTLGDVVDAISR